MTTVLIAIIFIVLCVMMFTKKLSAMFALPLMAFLFALVSGIPFADTEAGEAGILALMFVDGPVRLASSMMMMIFGAILAQYVKTVGIAQAIVRKISELSGDRPLVLGLVFMVILSLLFTTLGGLGSIIMIGSIVLPIMASVGISPLTSGCILIMASSIGGIFNLTNWGLYIDGMGLTTNAIRAYAWPLGAVFMIIGVVFVVVEVKFRGKLFSKKKISWAAPAVSEKTPSEESGRKVIFLAMLTPFVPLVMVLGLETDIITGFVVAILYGVLTTINKNSLRDLAKSVTQGISDTAGAIFLLIGIGMLLTVVMDPRVTEHIGPQLASVLPITGIMFVIFFSVLAPLALYRGPLNVWGLGLGIGAVMLSSGKISALALMSALMSTGQLQGVCDPTNTGNVWTAAYTNSDVNDILRKTLPYVWAGAIIGLIVGAVMYF